MRVNYTVETVSCVRNNKSVIVVGYPSGWVSVEKRDQGEVSQAENLLPAVVGASILRMSQEELKQFIEVLQRFVQKDVEELDKGAWERGTADASMLIIEDKQELGQ